MRLWLLVNQCDQCGFRWIGKADAERCPSRQCRSRAWNKTGTIQGEAPTEEPSPQPANPNPLDALLASGLLRRGVATEPTLDPSDSQEYLPVSGAHRLWFARFFKRNGRNPNSPQELHDFISQYAELP